ncbi:hypothetical protein FGU71_11960 [Erythrobacter insulae]|uniref:Uncharacterized protein n=1 Tax=Erythrobacter insulae TaxID=2584124 RepID=A0A547PEF0_9SPHN|nr:hypothetical protein [Erythrobacter insulae]TRD12507.1 hypothetical protein FGU71_11960 [Erythrobacter insulae]
MIASWPCPLPGGGHADELVLQTGANDAEMRLMLVAPLFDEHNKLRRHMAQVMRRLSEAGIMCVLPDLPGLNESTQPLEDQSLAHWRSALAAASAHFNVTHVLSFRSGAILIGNDAKGWTYAPQDGAKLLRGMIRARAIASKEAGVAETSQELNDLGRSEGITLAGWPIGSELFCDLETATPARSDTLVSIEQALIGGQGLWLRAEPGEDHAQADAMATAIIEELGKPE